MSEIQFEINTNVLLNAINNVSRAILGNSPIPSQNGIKIEGKENQLILTGTGDFSVQMILSNEFDENTKLVLVKEGKVVMDPSFLLNILKTSKSETIKIETIDGNLIHVQGDKAEYKINSMSPEDYTDIDFSLPSNELIDIDYDTICQIIYSTSFAVSDKDTRAVLKGINFLAENGTLTATATDSFRLAQKKINYQGNPFSVTVPLKCLNEVKQVFGDCQNFNISLNDKKIQFVSKSVILQSPLIEGSYPEVNRLIPNEFCTTLKINRNYLIDALERTSFIKVDNMSTVKIQMNSAEDICLYNWNMENGESKEVVPNDAIVSFEGEPLELSFSGSYASNALKALKTENVVIKFTGVMRPFILLNDDENQSVLQLILPIKTYH